jgi:hypothetical protein
LPGINDTFVRTICGASHGFLRWNGNIAGAELLARLRLQFQYAREGDNCTQRFEKYVAVDVAKELRMAVDLPSAGKNAIDEL